VRQIQQPVDFFYGDLLKTLSSGLEYIQPGTAYEEDYDSMTLWTDDESYYDDGMLDNYSL